MGGAKRIDYDNQPDRTGTHSLKWDRYAGRDILPMWVADMDFPSPPAVLEALHHRVEHAVFGYSRPPGSLVEIVAAMLADTYRWEVKPAWIVWLPGLVCGINVACRSVGRPQDSILTMVPVYPPFLSAPGLWAKQLLTVPLVCEKGAWRIDFDELEKAITPDTAMLLLCSPHNPVGRLFTAEELEQVAAICIDRNVVICSDEIHCDLILDPHREHVPLATLGRSVARRSITLMAPSKTYNIPGLGCSFAVIPDSDLRRQFIAAARGIVPDVNLLGFTAAEAAYREGATWLAETLAYLRTNADLVYKEINRLPGLLTSPVEATYLAWIDARGLGLADPAAFFENAGVGLSDGRDFGSPGFVRLNFGCSRNLLKKALARMRQALTERKKE